MKLIYDKVDWLAAGASRRVSDVLLESFACHWPTVRKILPANAKGQCLKKFPNPADQ
jgi:hypothetical protein